MTAFIKRNFSGTEYTMYDGKFVARFKRGNRQSFLAFLVKNFTVEEYFARLDAEETPLKILESKGYLLPHIVTWLKQRGYPVTVEGYKAFINDQVNGIFKVRVA